MNYSNWVPTVKCPTIESQVIKDLHEALSVSKEVLNRLADKEEDGEVETILNSYSDYIRNELQKDFARNLASRLAEAGAEMLVPALEKFLFSTFLPARTAVRMPTMAPVARVTASTTLKKS